MTRHGSRANPDLARRTILTMAATAPVLAMGLALPALAQAADGAALPADLASAWDAYNRATIRSDVATLDALVTADYALVNSDTSVQDKPSYLADFAVPGFRVDPYEIEQPMHRIWGDAALTGGLFDLGWTQDGRHHNRRLRVAHVWIRQNGTWRLAFTQLTRVPE